MTKDEIEAGVKKIFNDRLSGKEIEPPTLTFDFFAKHAMRFKFAKMYEAINVTFGDLKQLSELLKTDKIDLGDVDSYGGCESCDYGSSYEVTITANDIELDELDE